MEDDKPIIKVSTPNSKTYDTKVDVYTNDPKGDHESIHIAINTDEKSAHIIDTTDGKTEHTDVKCYLTSACIKYLKQNFNDNCYELTLLRWFRYHFGLNEDIEHYYELAPIIVEAINEKENREDLYQYIYSNVVNYCVKQIEGKNYQEAYTRYKDSILYLEENLARPFLEEKLIRTLKLKQN